MCFYQKRTSTFLTQSYYLSRKFLDNIQIFVRIFKYLQGRETETKELLFQMNLGGRPSSVGVYDLGKDRHQITTLDLLICVNLVQTRNVTHNQDYCKSPDLETRPLDETVTVRGNFRSGLKVHRTKSVGLEDSRPRCSRVPRDEKGEPFRATVQEYRGPLMDGSETRRKIVVRVMLLSQSRSPGQGSGTVGR